jgi:hypothetical protein
VSSTCFLGFLGGFFSGANDPAAGDPVSERSTAFFFDAVFLPVGAGAGAGTIVADGAAEAGGGVEGRPELDGWWLELPATGLVACCDSFLGSCSE